MNLHGRAEWTAAAVRHKDWLVSPPYKVIVHHSGGEGTFGCDTSSYDGQVAFMNALYAYGMNRDGAGTEYNTVLLEDTEWWEGFGPTVPGAHCVGIDPTTGQKASLSCYGVAIWGDFTGREINPTEFDSLVAYLQLRIDEGWIRADPIVYGHRDFAATSCPGSIYERLTEVEEALGASPVPPTPTPIPPPVIAPMEDDVAKCIIHVDESQPAGSPGYWRFNAVWNWQGVWRYHLPTHVAVQQAVYENTGDGSVFAAQMGDIIRNPAWVQTVGVLDGYGAVAGNDPGDV